MVTPSGVSGPNLTTERGVTRLAAVLVAAVALGAAPSSSEGQFSSSVNLVEVYASVTDRQGQPVRGLSREDFTVREDGAVQQVTAFTAGEFPLSVAVALDRSFSMAGQRLAAARSAATLFLDELRPAD
jgi:Ca-activated chloride channel family protein